MEPAKIQLEEIIWEITRECHNNCAYCGSKEGNNIKTQESDIKRILNSICQFPPKQIDISGGRSSNCSQTNT